MKFLNTFAVILVLSIFIFFVVVILRVNSVGQAAHDVMLLIVGGLLGIATSIVQYYYGSSQGSAKKNETIGAMLDKQKPPDVQP
jgi:succinate-acetate transporter protein